MVYFGFISKQSNLSSLFSCPLKGVVYVRSKFKNIGTTLQPKRQIQLPEVVLASKMIFRLIAQQLSNTKSPVSTGKKNQEYSDISGIYSARLYRSFFCHVILPTMVDKSFREQCKTVTYQRSKEKRDCVDFDGRKQKKGPDRAISI